MPQANAPAPAGAARPQQQQEEQQSGSFLWKIAQGLMMWMAMQFVMKQFMGNKPAATTSVTDADGNVVQVPAAAGDIPAYLLRPSRLDPGAVYNPIPQRVAPMWPPDSQVDIIVTLSGSLMPTALKDTPRRRVALDEKKFRIGNYTDRRSVDLTLDVPSEAQHNGTWWGHFYVGLSGSELDVLSPQHDPALAAHFVYPITQYIAKKKVRKVRSLLGGKDAAQEAEGPAQEEEQQQQEEEQQQGRGPIVGNYYHPNISLSFIPNTGVIAFPQTHPAVRSFLRLEPTGARDGSGQNSWYYPILFANTFWQLKAHMTQLNDTVKTVPMHIDLGNLAEWKFKTMAAIEMSGKEASRQAAFGGSAPGGGDGSEIEMIKEIFMDTNPILLSVTVVVSIAHMLLEFLAFGSDIAHYRKKKDNVGISVRSILANVGMQTVIFLYLLDQSQNTSWMILGTQAFGILVELWKVTTVVNVRVRPAPAGSLVPWRVAFEDKYRLSETEERTKEYDQIAFRYMYVAGVPLLLAYAGYSLVYEEHKSWYSYVIATLVGSVYAYGFLMMVPSLYINYRLKSVAHMPAKAMMYKFLNTFIDDLFAFTIKMPALHRLATFRDDIIFFIYLYQRWAYRIDYSRVNEFGQGGDDEDEGDKDKKDNTAKEVGEKELETKEQQAATPVGQESTAVKASGADTGSAAKRK